MLLDDLANLLRLIEGIVVSLAEFIRALVDRFADRLEIDVARIYELLRKAKHEYRIALMEVMATYNPDATERELEQRCVDLLSML